MGNINWILPRLSADSDNIDDKSVETKSNTTKHLYKLLKIIRMSCNVNGRNAVPHTLHKCYTNTATAYLPAYVHYRFLI